MTDPNLRQAVLDVFGTLANQTDELVTIEIADQISLAWKGAQLEVPKQIRSRMSPKPTFLNLDKP